MTPEQTSGLGGSAMVVMRVAGVKIYRSKGRVYAYHRATGTRIKAAPGSAEFIAEVAALDRAVTAAGPAKPGTLGALIVAYRSSPEFTDLAPRTRRDYDRQFDWLEPARDMPLIALTRAFVMGARDKAFQAHGRRKANYVVQVLRLLAAWAVDHGFMVENPAAGASLLKRPKDAPRANRPWTRDEIAAVIAAAPAGLAVGVALGVYTGLREGDVIRLPWSAIGDGAIRIRTGKTGEDLALPIPPALAAVIAAAPRTSPIVVTNARGRPFTENSFRGAFFKLSGRLEQAGAIAPGITFHGLRHTVGAYLAEQGCDPATIAALLGHKTLAMALHYSDRAARAGRVATAAGKLEQIGTHLSNRAGKLSNFSGRNKPERV